MRERSIERSGIVIGIFQVIICYIYPEYNGEAN